MALEPRQRPCQFGAVPEDKHTSDASTSPEAGEGADDGQTVTTVETLDTSRDTDLEDAMKEAMEAVEAREGGGKAEPAKSASDAVTESLLAAKKELEEVLEQTKKETEHLRSKWLRSAADFENFKKRVAREREETLKYGNERLLKDFLPVIDDLELAVGAAERAEDKETAADQLTEGVKMVLKKFVAQLEKHQVTTFEALGETFDPNLHEAVQQMNSDMEAGKVSQQLQRGFKISERLLRPAMVVVSLGPAAGDKAED